MLIRSQNRYTLTDVTATSITINPKTATIVAYITGTNDEPEILGEYSTLEKAIKVLDIIQDFYTAIYKKENYRAVSQMPQEEEI